MLCCWVHGKKLILIFRNDVSEEVVSDRRAGITAALLLICYSVTRTLDARHAAQEEPGKSSRSDRRTQGRVSQQHAEQLAETPSKPYQPSGTVNQQYATRLVETSSKPLSPRGALSHDRKPQHRAMLSGESSMCHESQHNAIQLVETSSNSLHPSWKKFTYQAVDPTRAPTAGNHSCQQTCQCLQTCVPCGTEEECCSEVLSRKPYIRSHIEHKRIVIASVDTKNYYYTWYAPITALIWQNAMDWKFVLLVVYEHDEELTPVLKSILQFTEAAGAEILYLKNPLKEPHYLAEMVVTLTRFFCGTFDWPEDTYVMTTDLDMWPLKRSYFDDSVGVDKDVHVLYANYFGDPVTAGQYPVCYIGMKVSMWREVMKVSKQDDIFHEIARVRDEQWGMHPSKVDQFATDQLYFAKQLHALRGYPDRVHFVSRPGTPPSLRLDRFYHASCFTLEEVSDAVESHALRPGFAPENWPHLRALLDHIVTEEDLLWVDTYASHFCEIMSCSNIPMELSSNPHYHP